MRKAVNEHRTLATIALAAALAMLVSSILAATYVARPPSASGGVATAKPPVLPLPGEPGYPPKLDTAAIASQELLPNLVGNFPGIPRRGAVGYPPVRRVTVNGSTGIFLVFNSAFYNRGRGPVVIWGHRSSTAVRDMTADQYIKLKSGSFALRRNVGALRYIFPAGYGLPHLHWHYLGAELYALYPVGHFGQFRRSQKRGFCMAEPDVTDYCGYKQPDELTQLEFMGLRTGDYYDALVEGQAINITGLRAGKYVVINWVDSACELKETTYADNAGATTIRLSYPHGRNGLPAVAVLNEQNSVAHPPCPTPAMDGAQAGTYLRRAVVRESASATGLQYSCARASATGFNCFAKWVARRVAFAGRISIAHVGSTKLARYATALDGISTRVTYDGTTSVGHRRWTMNESPLPSVQRALPVLGG